MSDEFYRIDMPYPNDGDASDDGENANEANMLSNAGLIEAVRSAAEMLAAEGLGSMVDIDSMQRQRASKRNSQPRLGDAKTSHRKHSGHAVATAGGAAGYSDDEGEDEDSFMDDDYSDTSDIDTPLMQGLTNNMPQRADVTHGLRNAGARQVNYNEDLAFGDLGGPSESTFIPEGFIDDDEDSNYEGSDFSVSSDDAEFHMHSIEASVRQASGFAKPLTKTQRKMQRDKAEAKGNGKTGRNKRNTRKKVRPKTPKYSPEVQRLLGSANQSYVDRDLFRAFNIFCDVIRLDPNCAPAWNTMALIREEEGKSSDALQLYTVSAHLNPSDSPLWERLYSMHIGTAIGHENTAKSGNPMAKSIYNEGIKQALYCISHVTKNEPKDRNAWMRMLEILEKQEDYKGMARAYRAILKADPYDMETIRMASVIYAKKRDDLETPIKWFTDAFAFYNKQAVEVAEEAIAQADRINERNMRMRNEGTVIDDEEKLDDDYDPEWAAYFRSNPTKTVPMEELGGYSYNDLNMVAELRILRREYEAAIVDIKRGARFIQSRGRELQWEDQELDDEMDSEYAIGPDSPLSTENALPIELRVKLGQCRMILGHNETAQMHIDPLFSLDVVSYEDLYTDIAETYGEVGNMEMSLSTYQYLLDHEATNQPSLWERMAKCYKESGDLASARDFAEAVVNADPNDIDMRLWLGEVYEELGHVDLAYSMVQAVEDIQREERIQQEAAQVAAAAAAATMSAQQIAAMSISGGMHGHGNQPLLPVEIWDTPSNVVQLEQRKPSENTMRRRRDAEDEHKRCLMAMRDAEVAFKKLDLLKSPIEESRDARAIKEYCVTAQRLFNDWRHMRAFFPADRNRPFVTYRNAVMSNIENGVQDGDTDTRGTAGGQTALQRRLARMKKRLSKQQQKKNGGLSAAAGDANEDTDADAEDRADTNVSTTFRGQPFERWFDMFLMYGKCLALDGEPEDALDMFDLVFQSNVFLGQEDKKRIFRLVMLSIAIHAGIHERTYEIVRWWWGNQPNKAITYKLMAYAMVGSAGATVTLTSANMYKYVRRQLIDLDEIYYSKSNMIDLPVAEKLPLLEDLVNNSQQVIATVSKIRSADKILTRCDFSALHSTAAHMMLVARTGETSIMQYTLALAMMPQDASVALHLGAAYLVHTTKRHTRDPQAMAIRGLAFIQRYAELQY
ncbi:transcription factor TFIIIC subunit tfc4, partial [Kickxella alabastrina]